MSYEENIYSDFEEEDASAEDYEISTPFDPKQVDITVEPATVSKLVDRIRHDEIDLFPEFQRKGNLWDNARMSQLIESILINLPLPAFYVDVANDDKWIVVDGLQRLSTFQRFIVETKNPLKLKKLEFLKDLEGKTYHSLGRVLQRRIDETQVTLFKIRKGTPKKVLTSLFHRINTGGLKLTSQEIRHALNQGQVTHFLKDISEQEWFKRHIRVSPKRMLDHELILRFCTFYRRGFQNYQPSLQLFLDDEMEFLNEKADRGLFGKLSAALQNSLACCDALFGEKMFSKALIGETKRSVINRSLFETTLVNIAYLTDNERESLLAAKASFVESYRALLQDPQFEASITANTNIKENVEMRHREMQQLIAKFTQHDYEVNNQ